MEKSAPKLTKSAAERFRTLIPPVVVVVPGVPFGGIVAVVTFCKGLLVLGGEVVVVM